MIEINEIVKEITDKEALLKCNISIDGKNDVIWFSVALKYEQYLCYERADAYIIIFLNYAIRNHHDIVCKIPISEDLFYQIDNYLIDALIELNPNFYRTKIAAPIISEPLLNEGAVGTGISCGVDSFYELATMTNSKFKNKNITHLLFNNVGAFGENDKAQNLYQSHLERVYKYSSEYGYNLITTNSNVMEVIKQNHYKSHTYSSLFPIYCLQKLFSTYHYASADFKYSEFTLKDIPTICCGSYEIFSLPMLSNRNLKIYSGGAGLSRLQKLKEVINYKPSYNYLNVCQTSSNNCGKCEKCVRTLLELDILGALDNYKNVFDVEYYKRNRKWYLKQMLLRIAHGKHDYFEIYPYLKKDVNIFMRISVLPKVILIKLMRFIQTMVYGTSLYQGLKNIYFKVKPLIK